MATGVNRVILVGNLGRDPEIQNFENGVKKATFTLATSEFARGKDGEKTTHTEWHNIVLWRNLADIAERFLRKGNSIYLEGKIRRREYEDKEGVKKFIYEILGDNLHMLGGPKDSNSNGAPAVTESAASIPGPVAGEGDDLPF